LFFWSSTGVVEGHGGAPKYGAAGRGWVCANNRIERSFDQSLRRTKRVVTLCRRAAVGVACSIRPSSATTTEASRTAARSPANRRVHERNGPPGRAHAKQTIPTGFSGDPPEGPAIR
jgi:hypothetical protein